MSSIFKNVMKSRRKRNKSRSTTPINFDATKPSDRPSNSIYPSKKHPAQPLHFIKVSSTTDEDSPRSNQYDDHYPSRRRSKSFESPLDETPSKNTKKSKFKSLRRKGKYAEPRTPDTVASGNGGDTPPVSKSEHDRLRSLQDSYPSNSRNSWSFESSDTPCSNTTSLLPKSSHDRQRRRSKNGQERNNNSPDLGGNHTPNKPGSKRLVRMASSGDDKPLSNSRLHDKDNSNNNHDPTTKRANAGTTKTVIMNGDIVLSNSYTSKSSAETATITSASSNSKAKAMRRKTERNARAAAALDEKANDLFELGYFDKAMACYTKALKLKRRTFAHLLEESDDINDDELILRDDSGNPVDAEVLVSMATSINNIGYLRQRSGDATPEETMAAYKKSLRIKRRILGNDSLSVGKTLNNIGSVHYLKRDFEKALSAYNEALEIMKANLGDKHPDVATVMSNIGDVYLAQGDKTTSVKYYRLALAIRWEAFGEKSPRTIRLLEKISNLEIGDMSQQMANNTLANKDFDDNASEVMAGSDYPPIAEGLRMLQESVKKDIARLDQMERDATIENLRDKIIIIRGMRDCWNGSGPELLDNDSASVQTAMSRLSSR